MSKIVFCDRSDIIHALSGCALVVTDSNVFSLYGTLFGDAHIIPPGESSKSKDVLFEILEKMSERGLSRGDRVAAIGGGVVSDVTGLAAALYMRGIEYINIPTTLLGAVDASVGGKTAIDLDGKKNIVGAFHMPAEVYIDLGFARTLPPREIKCGIGEIIKTCLLTKRAYKLLCDNFDALMSNDKTALEAAVRECVDVKCEVTSRDFAERGLRRILNVGHTVGHALESANNFAASHGEYVAAGIITECAMFKELVNDKFYVDIVRKLKKLVKPPRTSVNNVLKYAVCDKKNDDGEISVMLVTSPGDVADVRVSQSEFSRRYNAAIKLLKE